LSGLRTWYSKKYGVLASWIFFNGRRLERFSEARLLCLFLVFLSSTIFYPQRGWQKLEFFSPKARHKSSEGHSLTFSLFPWRFLCYKSLTPYLERRNVTQRCREESEQPGHAKVLLPPVCHQVTPFFVQSHLSTTIHFFHQTYIKKNKTNSFHGSLYLHFLMKFCFLHKTFIEKIYVFSTINLFLSDYFQAESGKLDRLKTSYAAMVQMRWFMNVHFPFFLTWKTACYTRSSTRCFFPF
jgi:hypothetical protein